jgi:hypothetical protein
MVWSRWEVNVSRGAGERWVGLLTDGQEGYNLWLVMVQTLVACLTAVDMWLGPNLPLLQYGT